MKIRKAVLDQLADNSWHPVAANQAKVKDISKDGEELDSCTGFNGLDATLQHAKHFAENYQPRQLSLF
jgi:hypothetical protein